MTTFIKAKLKKTDDQTNIDKYRVAANITSKLILRVSSYGLFGDDYWVSTLSSFYLTVSGIIIKSLKLTRILTCLNKKNEKV